MPPVFASDPAPQQLTAPCRKYSGRLHRRQDGMFVLDGHPSRGRPAVGVGRGLRPRSALHAPRRRREALDLKIPLSEGAAAYTETVTVSADRFERPEPVPSQQTLGSAELQNLAGC